jgi:hypothetical protein
MDLQRINVHIGLDVPERLDVAPLLGIFARWRHERDANEWLDLADYAHVPEGPLAMLVGVRGNLVLDLERGQPTLLYRNKRGLSGSFEERFAEATRRALGLATRLAGERGFPESWKVRADRLRLTINDRVSAANQTGNERELRELGEAIEAVAARALGGDARIVRETDPARLFGAQAHAGAPAGLDDLVRRLQDAAYAA